MTTYAIEHLEQIRALAGCGRLLALGGTRFTPASEVTLFDAGTRKVTRTLALPTHTAALAFLSPTALVVGGIDGQLYRFDPKTGEAQGSVAAHAGGVTALSASDKLVASAGLDGSVKVWSDASTVAFEFKAPCPQRSVALDAANQRVAVAGDDGVVRLYTFGQAVPREMSGHQGAVTALAFTPRDSRLASTGDDGTVRFWYLEGAVECEVRGEGDTGHAGGATAFTFLPSPAADAKDSSDRLVSTGHDAKVRTFRLDDKKRSKTFDVGGAQRAMALVQSDPHKSLVEIVTAGDSRTLHFLAVDLDGKLPNSVDQGIDGFASRADRIKTAQRRSKEEMVKSLPLIPEPAVLPLLKTLAADRDTSVRLGLAQALQQQTRRDARPLLRTLVHDKDIGVAQAALRALAATEDQPFAAYREGVRAPTGAVRIAALKALPALYPQIPLVPALVSGLLKDSDAKVRLAALDALEQVFPEGVEALVTGFEKGAADIRAEVMVRALMSRKLPQLQSISGRALDDDDVVVRQMAFVARVLEAPALGVVLQEMLQLPELFRRANGGKEPNPEQLAALRATLQLDTPPRELTQDDLTPLLVAMSAKATDVASLGTAGLLATAGDLRAVSALLQLSCEEESATRLWVARVLSGIQDSRARQRLASLTDDSDASVRAAAAESLGKLADMAPLELAGLLLRSSHEDVRKRGLSLLVTLPAKARDDQAESLLGHALEDEAAGVRAEAFKTLWSWHDKAPQGAIDRALLGRFADLRLAAVRQLALLAKAPTDDDQPPPKSAPAAWIMERLEKTVLDRDDTVSSEALVIWARLLGRDAAKPWQTALASAAIGTRVLAAKGAARLKGRAEAPSLREPLVKAMLDLAVPVRLAALDSVDALVADDPGPLTAGLSADALEVRVRAAELLARRGDERIIEPMRSLILDRELQLHAEPHAIEALRQRATAALATLGSPRTAALFANPLLQDDNPAVREQAARGLCNAGSEAFLLDALGHADVAVRSWAAEGLARLGDDRGLAVLTGTLQDRHLPIREGALRALVALGTAGDNALFLGLDDADDYLSDTFFATLLARDLRAAREGVDPDLLTGALSAQRPDVRYAAARALELRGDAGAYTQLLLDAVSPPKPEKAGDMKDWPEEGLRERLAMQLVQLLGADTPQGRYAAGQALLLRRRPLDFYAEVQRIIPLRPAGETAVPDTTQRGRASTDAVARRDWLRKLFAGAPGSKVGSASDKTLEAHRWISFGTYVGLLRLSSSDETVRRVRRDVVERMVSMAEAGSPAPASVIPALVRALDDEDTLVRKKAMAGLNTLLQATPDVALKHALSAGAADVGLLALQQLNGRGPAARPWFVDALSSNVAEVRQQAFVLLERSVGPGSLDALMAALASPHADLRLGVLNKLAASQDARVLPALRKALESERDDVRLLAAGLLAERKDDSCVPALAAFLTPDSPSIGTARSALATCATEAAALALSAHLQELSALPDAADTGPVNNLKRQAMEALAATRQRVGLEPLLERFDDPAAVVRAAALSAALTLANHRRPPASKVPSIERQKLEKRWPRWSEGVLQALRAASKARDPALRLSSATELDVGTEPENDSLLGGLFGDRDLATRVQAVRSYALRVEHHDAPLATLEKVIAQGTRELMLSAAEGLAAKQHHTALRPLLLFTRAGEVEEQVRAVLALGVGAQVRALEELELLAAGGTEEAPVDSLVRAAAIEALGRLFPALTDLAAKKRVVELVESAALEGHFRQAGVRGLLGMADDRAVSRLQQIAGNEDDHDREVRRTAIESLAVLADPTTEPMLVRLLQDPYLAPAALHALEACFPDDPLRVALSAASSELPNISGPALTYLLAEAEPAPLLERLANPRLRADLRAKVKYGLGRRPALPTEVLVKYADAEFPTVRDDMAWLMARHVLAGSAMTPAERQARADSLVASATRNAGHWADSVGTEDKAAEESALLRQLWAAGLHEADIVPLATRALAGDPPASSDSPEPVGGLRKASALLRQLWSGPSGSAPASGGLPAPASVRAESARALRKAGAAAVPAWVKGSRDLDATVRRAAVAALVGVDSAQAVALIDQSQPLDVLAFDALRADAALLRTPAQRSVMLPKLIAASDPSALMVQAEQDGDEEVQRAALMALGRMGGEDVAEFLARLAFSAGGGDDDDDDDGDEDEEEDEDDGPSPDISMPGARRFEFEEDDSAKFWEVLVTDDTCTVRFGKIGAAGQKKPKKLASPEAAQKEAEKLIREKTNKGYAEVKPKGVKPPKSVAAPSAAGAKPVAAASNGDLQPWGTPALREAAFRALRRAQRTNERRANKPTWFTEEQLVELAANPELAESLMPSRPTYRGRDDDDDSDDDYDEDDNEGDDDE